MHEVLNIYIVPGLVIGCVYAIGSSGLVMAYTTSGVLNLGYGAIAYAIAMIYYELHTAHDILPAWPALALCVLVIGPLIGVILWKGLFKWLAELGLLAGLIAAIGLTIAVPALCLMIFNPGQISYAPGVTPAGQMLHTFGPIIVSTDQLYGVGAAVVVAAGLFYILRFTVTGLKMRAVFDSPTVAALTGTSPATVTNLSWALSGGLAAIGGVFLAPLLGLTPEVFLSLTVASLAAALIGGMRSIPISFAAAVAIGVVSSVLASVDQSNSLLDLGAQPSVPFLVMGATLLLRPRGITSGQAPRKALEPPVSFDRLRVHAAKITPGVVIVLALPAILSSYWTGVVGFGLIFGVIFLGFTVALGNAGLLPLGQAALCGIGGFIAGSLAASDGVPLLLAIIAGGLGAAVIGGILAVIGGRLGSLEFGLLTLAFGLFADNFLFNWSGLVPPSTGRDFKVPSLFGLHLSGIPQYYLFAAILGLALLAAAWFKRRVGSFYINAGRMDPTLARATGVDVRAGRVIALTIAAFLAGIGGGLIGVYQLNLSPNDVTTTTGLVWLAIVVLIGIRSYSAAVVAGILYTVFPALIAQWLPIRWGPVSTVLFGLGALVLAQDPRGALSANAAHLQAALRAVLQRLARPAPPEGETT
jgi:branched-chain amino acid transport system permease protein